MRAIEGEETPMTPNPYNAREELRRLLVKWKTYRWGIMWRVQEVPEGSMLDKLCLFWAWCCCGFCKIRDVHGNIIALNPLDESNGNEAQLRIHVAMMLQAEAGKPIRLVIGKARKCGATTWIEALLTWFCMHYKHQRASTIAHESEATDTIFEIAKRVSENFTLSDTDKPVAGDDHRVREIRFSGNGSTYRCRTAGGEAVGAGGTPSMMHGSEVAKWKLNKLETLYNATIAVPDVNDSIIVLESTFKGRDEFWYRFDGARKGLTSYGHVFIPWFLDKACKVEVTAEFVLAEDEIPIIAVARADGIELSNEQLQWRRNKIAELGSDIFRQEYPSTPEEAVQAARGLILPGMRECLIDELPFDPGNVPWSQRVGGYDGGYNDPCVIGTAFYVDRVLYLTDVWRGFETLADEQVEGLIEGHTYSCDPSGLSDRKALQRKAYEVGLHVRLVQAPRRKHSGEEIERTELQLIIDLMRDGRLKVIRAVADQLIVECDDLIWNDRTGKPEMKRSEACGHYDTIMMLKYAVMGLRRHDARPAVAAVREYRPSRRFQFAGV